MKKRKMTTKMMNVHDIATAVISCFGLTISVDTIDEVLSIVLVSVSIINIIVILFFRIRNIIKGKGLNEDSTNEITNNIKDAVEDIKDVIEDDRKNTDEYSNGKK